MLKKQMGFFAGIIRFLFPVLLSLFAALAIGELSVRIFRPQKTIDDIVQPFRTDCFRKGKYNWIALKANADCFLSSNIGDYGKIGIKTNSLGFRDEETEVPKPKGTYRILLIGDSFTFGWGIRRENTFVERLEGLLKKDFPEKKIEAVNAGMPATGPTQEYLFLKNEGLGLEPDLAVIESYPYTDVAFDIKDAFWEDTDHDGWPDKSDSLSSYVGPSGMIRSSELPYYLRIPFLNSSHLFILFFGRLFPAHKDQRAQTYVRDIICLYKEDCRDMDIYKTKTEKLYLEMGRLLRERKIPFFFLQVPSEFSVFENTANKYFFTSAMLPGDRNFAGRYFADFFEKENLDYLSLFPLYQRHADEPIFFKNDDHWNDRGHELVAKELEEKIRGMMTENP